MKVPAELITESRGVGEIQCARVRKVYQARPKSRFAVIIDIKVADVFTVVHQLLFGYLPVVLQEPFRITLPDEVIKANLDQTELVRNTASGLVAPTSETQATFFLQQELAGSVIQ